MIAVSLPKGLLRETWALAPLEAPPEAVDDDAEHQKDGY